MALSEEQRREIDDLVRTRVAELERDIRRELTASSIRLAAQRTPTVRAMPCIVQSVGVVQDGVLINSWAACIPDDAAADSTPIVATRVGASVANDRALLLFFPGGSVYVVGPVPQ